MSGFQDCNIRSFVESFIAGYDRKLLPWEKACSKVFCLDKSARVKLSLLFLNRGGFVGLFFSFDHMILGFVLAHSSTTIPYHMAL